MVTPEEHFYLLFSDNPSDRGVAAMVLNRLQVPIYQEAVKQMVLKEEHHLPLMLMSHAIAEWNDNTLEMLMLKIHDERVLFTLLEAARRQKRRVSDELIGRMLDHNSIFVRLAALKQAIVAKSAISLASIVEQLRTDADSFKFVAVPNMPSPVFKYKSEFFRLLSRLQWIVSQREKASECGVDAAYPNPSINDPHRDPGKAV
jgi:hypothetical protein